MIRARTIMNTDPVRLMAEETLSQAARKMSEKKAKMALVYDKEKFIGVITEEEIFAEMFVKGKVTLKAPIGTVCHKDYLTVDAGYAVERIERSYKDNPRSRFVVMDNGNPVGIITELEHVASMRDFTHFHYVMQETILLIFGITTAFFLFYFSPLGSVLRGG